VTGSCELSVVVPAYQEGAHLADSIHRILGHVEAITQDCEIIVVDDGSTDKTWAELKRLHDVEPKVLGVRLSRNFGKDYALSAGLERARGRAVITLDADLQHPPADIARFYETWKSVGVDVVDGIKRRRDHESIWRRSLSRLFNSATTWMTGVDFRNCSDFKLLDRKVIEAWKSLPERRCFFRGMVSWVGFRHARVEFSVSPRQWGASRWNFFSLTRLAGRAVISYSAFPLRMIHVAAAGFFLLALWLGFRALYLKFVGQAVDGITTVIVLLLLVGSLLLLGLGILGEYAAAIYEEIKARPRYIVTEVLDATPADHAHQIGRLAESIGLLTGHPEFVRDRVEPPK